MNNEEFDFTNPQMLRKTAEEILKKNQKKATHKPLKSDDKKLVHELQVHQIELEMQNEELVKAYQMAQEALKKYTLLYDFAPMGYMTISGDGTIYDLNFSASEIIGEKRISLMGANLKRFISDESKSVFNEFFDKIFSQNLKQSCVILLRTGNNASIRVYMEGVFVSEDNASILSFLDISGLVKQLS